MLNKKRDFVLNDSELSAQVEKLQGGVSPVYECFTYNRQATNNIANLREVPSMLQDPLISSVLSFYMSAAFQAGEDQKVFWVKSDIQAIKDELESWHRKINAQKLVPTIAYNLAAWGNLPIKLFYSDHEELEQIQLIPDFTKVVPLQMFSKTLGYVVEGKYSPPYEYVYAQLEHTKNLGGIFSNFVYGVSQSDGKDFTGQVNEFSIGPSLISNAIKPWRSINTIEEALTLHRLDMSNYYRIISVAVGDNVASKTALNLLNFYRNIFKKTRRVTYDSGGMASIGRGQEFEVIVPKTTKENVEIKDVGGQIEFKDAKDLDVQYNKLFAALGISPSQIGFSENLPSSLGESPAIMLDKRTERTVKSLVFSTFNALKAIDLYYLRSRGYRVDDSMWSYKNLSLSAADDKQRLEVVESRVKILKSLVQQFKLSGVKYDESYLTKSLLAPSLSSMGVDWDNLNVGDKKVEIQANRNWQLEDRRQVYSSLRYIGVDVDEADTVVPVQSGLLDYTYYANAKGCYPDDLEVNTASVVKAHQAVKLGSCLKNSRLPKADSVYSTVGPLTAGDLSQGSFGRIKEMVLLKNDAYLFRDKQSLVDYLYQTSNGIETVEVSNVYEEKIDE